MANDVRRLDVLQDSGVPIVISGARKSVQPDIVIPKLVLAPVLRGNMENPVILHVQKEPLEKCVRKPVQLCVSAETTRAVILRWVHFGHLKFTGFSRFFHDLFHFFRLENVYANLDIIHLDVLSPVASDSMVKIVWRNARIVQEVAIPRLENALDLVRLVDGVLTAINVSFRLLITL